MNRLSVLEVGSGHRPARTSTVLLDRYADSRERTGPLTTDGRPFVLAAGESLPFRSKSFRRCIARQVLEHSDDVVAFSSEMSRVADGGLVETPSPLGELLLRRRQYHRWIVAAQAGGLTYWARDELATAERQGEVFEELYSRNVLYYVATQTQLSAFVTRYAWLGSIPIREGTRAELDLCIRNSVSQLTASPLAQVRAIARGVVSLLWRRAGL